MALRRMVSPCRPRPQGATLETVGDGERRGGRHCPVDQTQGAHSRSGAPARRATQAPAQVSGVGELEKELDGGRAVPLAGALGEEADGCGDGYVGGVVSRGLEG